MTNWKYPTLYKYLNVVGRDYCSFQCCKCNCLTPSGNRCFVIWEVIFRLPTHSPKKRLCTPEVDLRHSLSFSSITAINRHEGKTCPYEAKLHEIRRAERELHSSRNHGGKRDMENNYHLNYKNHYNLQFTSSTSLHLYPYLLLNCCSQSSIGNIIEIII